MYDLKDNNGLLSVLSLDSISSNNSCMSGKFVSVGTQNSISIFQI